jgi:indole-3-acetate monooxygenase
VYDAITRLSPEIDARAAEIEATRRLPLDLVQGLRDAGCFRLLRPRSHGGLAADWPSAMRVFEQLARADASAGWTTLIGATGWRDLVALPPASFDALFLEHPDAITAGVFSPTGSVRAESAGYRVTGRWAFASGCEHADWLYGNCVEGVVDGVPRLRAAVLAPDRVVIEDTWHVSGLQGTGSQHFHVDEISIPAEWTFAPLDDPPCVDLPLVRIPVPSLFAMGVACIATGVASGALDDIRELAAQKTPLFAAASLATSASFQRDFADAETALRAARQLLWDGAESSWGRAESEADFAPHDVARLRANAAWATCRAAEVVDFAYRAGGGGSVYLDCPLQRRWRDVHAITQHFLVRPDTMVTAGAALMDRPLDVPVF